VCVCVCVCVYIYIVQYIQDDFGVNMTFRSVNEMTSVTMSEVSIVQILQECIYDYDHIEVMAS